MNQIAIDVTGTAGNPSMGSWNATGSTTFNTGKAGCNSVNRPNGSGAGRDALLLSLNAGDGCIQFSRSSSLDTAVHTPSLTYVPYAVDAVSYAVTSNSSIPRQLNLADLSAIYHCDPNYVGTAPFDIHPVLPQSGSGTRTYWEGKMGLTDAQANAEPCIINGVLPGTTTKIEEHTASFLTSSELVPFSIGNYTSQANGLIAADQRGNTVLGVIGTGTAGAAVTGGTDPQLLNGGFSVKRDVYNVVPTSKIGTPSTAGSDPSYATVFGAGGTICSDAATILHYGFSLNPNCGSLANHS